MSEGIYRAAGEGRSFGFGAVPILVKLEHDETDDAFALVEATFPAGLPGPPDIGTHGMRAFTCSPES